MKITKQQLERLIKEEMENTLQEKQDSKYEALLSGSETLLTKWQPKTSEGELYKKQLHKLLSKVKS